MSIPVIAVEHLAKDYHTGMRRKRVHAVNDVSFSVEKGEIFGFVGPNGAGKTTTIRALLGLIRPTSGRCFLFGQPIEHEPVRTLVGFLPESPYFYDYLTAREFLDLVARLYGQESSTRRRRVGELLAQMNLTDAADRPLRKYSKGMLQRVGLAQVLINDPELLILDEPMSGLDPLGRREVRDLMLRERDAGKTVFFSTHILPDVEAICDRVAIIAKGRVHEVGSVEKLLNSGTVAVDVVLKMRPEVTRPEPILPQGAVVHRVEEQATVTLAAGSNLEAFLTAACNVARIVSVTPRRESLEELFLRKLA